MKNSDKDLLNGQNNFHSLMEFAIDQLKPKQYFNISIITINIAVLIITIIAIEEMDFAAILKILTFAVLFSQ